MHEPVRLDDRGLVADGPRPAMPGQLGTPQTVAAMVRSLRNGLEGAEVLVGRHTRLTAAQLDQASDTAAAALCSLGIRPGDRVAASLPNHPDIVIAFLAAMKLGAIWVGINRTLAPPEKEYILRDCGAAVLLADPAVAAEVRDDPAGLRTIVVDPTAADDEWRAVLRESDARVERLESPDPYAPAAIAYTSGTTGFPKGAVHSQHNLLLPGAVIAARGIYSPAMRQGVCLPLTALNLMVLGPLVALQVRAPIVCMDRTDPVGLAEWVREERIATFSAVPAMVHGLLTHPGVHEADLVTLTRPGVGGADLPESFRTLYRERFGAEVTIGYGLTEAPTAVTMTDPDAPPVPASAGPALPQLRIEIHGDEGRALPVGAEGEICVGPATDGPWAGVYTPFLGYWNRPDATREALRGGLLNTGDVGRLDGDGNLFVLDRRNDLVIRGGANIYPAEVERVLHADERVAACAVLGRQDEHLGERVVAFVQLAPGVAATDADLAAHCAGELACYKVPDEWIFVDDFPRTPTGKIRKPDLRAWLAARS